MKYISTLWILLLFTLSSCEQQKPTEAEIIAIAHEWTDAWNGKIDKDRMMRPYDKDMHYYWRGRPMTYEEFEHDLINYIIPYSDENGEMLDPNVNILGPKSAVVAFNTREIGHEMPQIGVTLGLQKKGDEWRIIHVHESPVRPLPPNDFEAQFNVVALQFQKDYMGANCDAILPLMDEDLVVKENGEEWPLAKMKEFCPHLPEKPVTSTNRSYKILSDELVFEYVSHMYTGIQSGETINETQAIIWAYSYENKEWKIQELGTTRYKVKE